MACFWPETIGPHNTSTEAANWLHIKHCIRYRLCLLMHLVRVNKVPHYLGYKCQILSFYVKALYKLCIIIIIIILTLGRYVPDGV